MADEPAEKQESFSQLVVVGSSAGGIEALSMLVAALPTDFPAPIVIAQHLDPTRVSHLGDILARRSTLPVRTFGEQEDLEAGVVFVVPSNRDVEITDHDIRLRGGGHERTGPQPSIDLLFSSAADTFGETLVAVVLTGTGSDGATGARRVKEAGGTVIIQNPQTASHPAMPQSLAPTTVDIVADVENIGPLLYDLLTTPPQSFQSGDDQTFQTFLEQLRDRSGVDFVGYKRPTILRRLQRRMVAVGTERLDDYVRLVERDAGEYDRLVNSFLIKVTEFFRDAELFDHLRDVVLPKLIEETRGRDDELRLWSAGCATGEEAYSLAMLVLEALGEEVDGLSVRIFATDLDTAAVAYARRGIYPASALANVPADLIERYFIQLDGEYEVKKAVRAMVVFGQHDLGQRAPFPRIDLALCRNVLIYFTTELQQRALQLFAFSLRDGGYLVLGKAESTSPLPDFFVLEQPRLKLYRRRGDRVLIPPARIRESAPLPLRLAAPRRPLGGPAPVRLQPAPRRGRAGPERFEGLLLNLPVGVAVVDRRYDIQAINGTARRLLGIHSTAIGEDFVHLARNMPSGPLRAAIDAAFRGESPTAIYEVTAAETADAPPDGARHLRIASHRQPFEADGSSEPSVAIVVTDVTELVQEQRRLAEALARQDEAVARLSETTTRAAEVNRQLFEANHELTNANATLRSANEELLVGHEEAQAATEEVETLNEELQATNEELETLNEELQATVEELNTTNDDLQARTLELQDLAATLDEQRRGSESERSRLATVLASIDDAVLLVGRAGEPVLTNAAYDRMLEKYGADFVPEDEDGKILPAEAHPRRRAALGESFSATFILTDADGTRCWFEANGRPIDGVGEEVGVVVVRDITDRSLRRMQDEFLALASHELRTPLTALFGFLQLLDRQLRPGTDDDRLRQFTQPALAQGRRMTTLLKDLLDVGRLQGGQLAITPEPLDLVPVVRQAVEVGGALADGRGIGLETPTEPVPVDGDAGRLEQVLLNLLSNAVIHAAGGERIDVRLRREGDVAAIDVRDDGPGIPAAEQAKLFSRFYQVVRGDRPRRGGLGLGLFIAREIVAAHGGRIDVTSEVGKGATFTIRLPIRTEGMATTPDAAADPPPAENPPAQGEGA